MPLRLIASSAGKWGPDGCAANPTMEEEFGAVVEQSEKQREGDAAHYYFTQTFREGGAPAIGSVAPNGAVITDEMAECAVDIVRDITDTLTKGNCSPTAQLYVEYSFNPRIAVAENNVGRGDAVIIDRERFIVYLWEYKYGHRFVDEYKNWQIANFAIGVLESLLIPPHLWPQWRFVGTVAQPRNYHPTGSLREWHFTGEQAVQYAAELKAAAAEANSPHAMTTTGEHCRDCSGRHACGAFQRVAMNMVDLSLERTPQELPPEALGLTLKMVRAAMKRLGALAEGLEEQAMFKARSGIDVPHWKADYSQGREKWTIPPAEVIALGESFGVDLSKPPQTLTPHQAKKAGLDETMIKTFAERPRGAMTLIPFSTADAARRFQ